MKSLLANACPGFTSVQPQTGPQAGPQAGLASPDIPGHPRTSDRWYTGSQTWTHLFSATFSHSLCPVYFSAISSETLTFFLALLEARRSCLFFLFLSACRFLLICALFLLFPPSPGSPLPPPPGTPPSPGPSRPPQLLEDGSCEFVFALPVFMLCPGLVSRSRPGFLLAS